MPSQMLTFELCADNVMFLLLSSYNNILTKSTSVMRDTCISHSRYACSLTDLVAYVTYVLGGMSPKAYCCVSSLFS